MDFAIALGQILINFHIPSPKIVGRILKSLGYKIVWICSIYVRRFVAIARRVAAGDEKVRSFVGMFVTLGHEREYGIEVHALILTAVL